MSKEFSFEQGSIMDPLGYNMDFPLGKDLQAKFPWKAVGVLAGGGTLVLTGVMTSLGGDTNELADQRFQQQIVEPTATLSVPPAADLMSALNYRNQFGVCPHPHDIPEGARIADPQKLGAICPTK